MSVLLSRAYDQLNEGGEIFAEIDPDPDDDLMEQYSVYIDTLNKIPNVEASLDHNKGRQFLIFHLKKSPDAPERLPVA